MQSLFTFLLIGGVMMAAFGAEAQVTGVVTSTTGTVIEGTGGSLSPPVVFSGDQIDEREGGFDTGFGVTIAATSEVQPGLVEFRNGSGTSGRYTFLTTETDVDITFTNNTTVAQSPVLHSEIIAAGLGLFVGGECLTSITPCDELTGTPYTFQSFQQYPQTGVADSNMIAGTSVEFHISSGGDTLYELNASTDLVFDAGTNSNVFVDNISQAQTSLNGFQQQTPSGSQTAHGYNWDTTDLTLPIPVMLAPGASATLTYQTITNSYSRTDCVDFTACVIGYSAFGDPIGMSGGADARTTLLAFALPDVRGPVDGLTFATFDFAAPTFSNGVLTYVLAGGVPEPGPWGLMLTGFGLAGMAARRRGRRGNPIRSDRTTL
jgi:hypothetical protein